MFNIFERFESETSSELNIERVIVDKVISHKWQNIHQNLYEGKEVEDSGLCKFKVRLGVVQNRINKLEKFLNSYYRKQTDTTDPKQLEKLQKKINTCLEEQNYLKTKLNEV